MLVSRETRELKSCVTKLLAYEYLESIASISISLDYTDEYWYVTPIFEGAGDGFSSYFDNPLPGWRTIVMGRGRTLPMAFKSLRKLLDRIKREHSCLEI